MDKSYEAPSAGTGKLAGQLFLYSVLAQILCLFLYVSVTFLVTSWTTKPAGYEVYETRNGQLVLVDTVYFTEDGDTTQTVAEGQTTVPIRTPVPAWANITFGILEQVLMLVIFVAYAYSTMWKTGDRDKNSETHHDGKRRPWRGLLIGSIAMIPYAAVYLLLLTSKLFAFFPAQIPGYYRLCNMVFYPLLNVLLPVNCSASDVSAAAMLILFALLLIIPLTAQLGYTLGHNRVSLLLKTVYKNGKKPAKKRA